MKKFSQIKQNKSNKAMKKYTRRRVGAGLFNTSSAGAYMLLIALVLSVFLGLSFSSDSYAAGSITITSGGMQSINVLPKAGDAVGTSINADNVNVTSTCHAGYNFIISTSVDNNNLYLDGNSNNNQSGKYFTPASGSTALSSSPNTWGFYYSDSSTATPTANSTFSPVPALSSPVAIKTASETASEEDIDDDFSIYYGVAVGSSLPSGAYKMIKDSSSTDGTISYYATLDPECESYDITINAGRGINTLSGTDWTNSGTSTITKRLVKGTTIDLSEIIPTYVTGYNGARYAKASGDGTLTGSTFTVGDDTATITLSASGLDAPVCTIQGGSTKVYNRSATTLTATDNTANYGTDMVDLTYSFGYASNGTNDLANFTTATTTNTLSVAKAAFRGARYYGVTVTATDKTDNTLTSTCTSGTVDAASTGTNVANRTTMTLVNSRVNFDATTNGGTLNGTSPVYVYYGGTATYSSRTGSTARAIPTATPPDGYEFDGWYTLPVGGYKVINADGTLTGTAVSGWTNASSKWVKTGTSNSATTAANQLYAQYIENSVSMQEATFTDCGKNMTDSRDGESYATAVLADGNCWMLDNLRLGVTDLTTDLTSDNTNLSTTITASTWNSYRKTSGFTSYTAPMFNSASANNTIAGYGSGSKKIGVYYNYCAASANTYCYDEGSGTGNASYDVCPAGWRMPTGGSSGEYQALYTAYSSNATNFRNALSTPLSGRFYDSSAVNQGSYGFFWSSTRNDGYSMYRLYVTSSSVDPSDYRNRDVGLSVRCVKEAPTTMQNATSAKLAKLMPNAGDTTTLEDERDGQEYSIAKINNQYWMTRNLAIGCDGTGSTYGSNVSSKSLTSSDSNVDTTWSTPTDLLSTSANSSSTSGYTTAAMQCSSKYGAWYNYKAATAGTISGSSNSTNATKDICPAGWRLPTNSEFSGITSSGSSFSPVTGGNYYNGSPSNTSFGRWWSATASYDTTRYYLSWDGSSLGTYDNRRYFGVYVRCVRS